ncbi:MAG: glycosyltransferase family 4 protein [Verrucomicrobiota bacterium]
MSVLFVQNRPIRAGAQTSLARLVDSEPIRSIDPVVLLNSNGWLSDQLSRQGTSFSVFPFKSSRALSTRIFGLSTWARKVAVSLGETCASIQCVVANDHQECPLAIALAKELGDLPVLSVLRTPGMTKRDFEKYDCDVSQSLMVVGRELQERTNEWTSKSIALFEEGFEEAEFQPWKPVPQSCPTRLLLIGSEAPRKGFTDFIEALQAFERQRPDFPGWTCDLTGSRTDAIDALLAKPMRSQFHFLGRIEGFPARVREYDFAIHPSRAETFGMAPIEAILAGTPTLLSSTGVAAELSLPSSWTFPPGNIASLTERLEFLWESWPPIDIAAIQSQIRARFHINHTASAVRTQLDLLINRR